MLLPSIVISFPAIVMVPSLFIVMHVSPDHPSHLPRILQRKCNLPVHHAGDGEAIQPGHVYVAPPWYDPWVWYGGHWLYRPYPYHRYWYKRHWRRR